MNIHPVKQKCPGPALHLEKKADDVKSIELISQYLLGTTSHLQLTLMKKELNTFKPRSVKISSAL